MTPSSGQEFPAPETSANAARGRWLLSYADFVTLLFALFVLLYASARFDADQAAKVVSGIEHAFPAVTEQAQEIAPNSVPATLETHTLAAKKDDPGLSEYLAAVLAAPNPARDDAAPSTRLREEERGLIVELTAAEFFPAGDAEIAEEKKRLLSDLAPILVSSGRSIHFEGHTDDQAIQNDQFPSNWELSAARAGALARYFIEEQGLDPQWVATTGYAQYRPLVPNLGPAARARNRRVEIILLNPVQAGKETGQVPDRELRSLGRMLEALPPVPEAPPLP